MKTIIKLSGFLAFVFTLSLASCSKDYYQDSGLQSGVYKGTSFEFLNEKPFFFDTLVNVIELAEMKPVISDSTVTFFAPTNNAIRKAMNALNANRYNDFKDSLKLSDVPAEVWRKFLSRYIIREKFMLKDIPRRDLSQPSVYPGMNIESFDGYIMNLGVEFSDYNGTKDVGPRKVMFSSVGELGAPDNITTGVATSDIQTSNGIIHILNEDHVFAFDVSSFVKTVEDYIE